jgi:biotin transporter BioY
LRFLASSGTLAEAALPVPRETTVLGTTIPAYVLRNIALVLVFAAIVALCGRARFYLPDNPVPITLQTFAVLLTGASLGSRLGLASIVLFYLVGMAGVPVFQGGNNGWDYVSSSATGGYLIGFIAATYVTGFLAERGWDRRHVMWALIIGNFTIYVPGLLWLGAKDFVPWEDVLSKGMYPFIVGDLLKLMMVGIVLPAAWAVVNLRKR